MKEFQEMFTSLRRSIIYMLLVTSFLCICVKSGYAGDASPAPPQITGTWFGSLAAPAYLMVVFHFAQAADGTISATIDSPEQQALGGPCGPVTNANGTITVPVPVIDGSFQGHLSDDGSTVAGTWTQKGKSFALSLAQATAPTAPLPSALPGQWSGRITTPMGGLTLIVHFYPEANGSMIVSVDSPDQGVSDIPGGLVSDTGGKIAVPVTVLGGSYQGRLSSDGTTLTGTWQQMGQSDALILRKSDKAPLLSPRPQTPQPPFPYHVKDVTFASTDPGVTLSGTLTYPQRPGKYPAALLVAGSGPNDRNEMIFRHEIFAVVADYLTRRGFVVLRYDKRGVGRSTGSYKAATIYSFADDAQGGVNYLKTVAFVDPRRIGIIGHSEGGYIAPLVASRDHDVRFIVLLAGPSVPGYQVLVRQYGLIEAGEGEAPAQIGKDLVYEKSMLAITMRGTDDDATKAKILALYQKSHPGGSGPVNDSAAKAQIDLVVSPWFRTFLDYDPRPVLEKLAIPVLALNGSKDRQVDPQQNLPVMRTELAKSRSHHYKVIELPGLNHLFQDCQTGAISEYSTDTETFSPKALKIMGDWLVGVTSR